MLTIAYSLWEDFTGEFQAQADPEGQASLAKRPCAMAQDVTAKDKKDEKEKENRKRIHLLECNTTREGENCKEET